MKRKLISFEAFKNLEENSLTRAENELVQAEDVLGKALGIDRFGISAPGNKVSASTLSFTASTRAKPHTRQRMTTTSTRSTR